MEKRKKLFSTFPPVSRKEWEEKIIQDLKGAPWKKLVTKTPEGIELRPYYHQDDLEGLEYLDSLPGSFPYNRSAKIQLNDWEIREDIKVKSIEEANARALTALNRGASSLAFYIPDELSLNLEDIKRLLKDIYFECIHINFISPKKSDIILRHLSYLVQENNIPGDKLLGSINADPLGEFATNPDFTGNPEDEMNKLAELVKSSSRLFPFFKTIGINAQHVHNAGGSAVQELAYMLAQVSEYMEKLGDKGLSTDDIACSFQLNFATGASYFMEIAKLRAARLLFANLIRAWKPEKERSERTFIHCSTSEWNQTLYDPYVNMLRGTTESMSAALGGANSLTVNPFDKSFRESSVFSERIARNTQIILKEEAHLNKVVDPSGGSYYIENLTHSLAEEAWKLFLEIEDKGGFTKSFREGFIQNLIKETAKERDLHIATRREILLGTNQYPDNLQKAESDMDNSVAFPASEKTRNGVELLEKYRGAVAFEKLRLKTESSEKTPVVFLLTYGNLNWRKARAGFASSFFACAGYAIIDNLGFESVEEGLKAATEANADIIVLCSSDDAYPEMAKEAIKQKDENISLVIAGYPKDQIEELKEAGIKHFIHLKSNVLEELTAFNSILGIN